MTELSLNRGNIARVIFFGAPLESQKMLGGPANVDYTNLSFGEAERTIE